MNQPLRVLHVVVNMNRGGTETLIMNLYRNLDLSKVQFDFLTCKEGIFDKEIVELGGKVHRIPYVTDVGHFGYLKALEDFFSLHREYKIVHSHLDKMSGFVLRAAQNAGIPIRIAHSHGSKSEGGIAAKIYKWISGQLIPKSATNYMACSKSAARWLFNKESVKASILKNGIDLKKFVFDKAIRNKLREELGVGDDTIVVGHIGRFCTPKNHAFLVDVFSLFAQVNNNSILILVGDGKLRKSIERKVAALGLLNKVRFLGVRDDIHRILQTFDVFVFPSLHEGFGITLVEAQGVGVPCVVSDCIPHEVDMNINLLEFLPITNKCLWVEKINDSIGQAAMHDTTAVLREKGYDINNVSEWLEKFYLRMSG